MARAWRSYRSARAELSPLGHAVDRNAVFVEGGYARPTLVSFPGLHQILGPTPGVIIYTARRPIGLGPV